jgi:glycosyltransferase involved in cell wall biosynthesis
MVFPMDCLSLDPSELKFTLAANTSSNREYAAMAEIINRGRCQLVSLQHEFGIFGGEDGEYVVDLVAGIRKPVVTTLHTVSPELSQRKVRILESLVRYSNRIIVLSDEDASILTSLVRCPPNQIEVIRHGVPDTQFNYPADSKVRRRLNAGMVFVSSGHVRPSKGYHLALRALALFKQSRQDFRYLVIGRVQPQYEYGLPYREEVRALVEQLGLSDHFTWVEEYLPLPQLIEHITAADVGLVTYTEEDQASSGVLPLMLALGRPVVATAFAYAVRMANRAHGLHLSKSNNPEHLCEAIVDTIRDIDTLQGEMVRTYSAMRPYIWSRIGEEYERVFHAALSSEPRIVVGSQ